ncbi:MAG: glutaredoxin family protein [Geobacter sp.]|nr:glutaredoxin family protein [Geobacter sp.]
MNRHIFICTLLLFAALAATVMAQEPADQSIVAPHAKGAQTYPSVVIYTLSTCPHCAEAKEYLHQNNIPFSNREVDTDETQMAELMKIYDEMGVPEQKRGVPLLIIGNKIRMQGFTRDKFEKAMHDAEK